MKLMRVLACIFVLTALIVTLVPAAAQEVSFPVALPEAIAEGRPVTITVQACIGEDQTDVRNQFDAQLARFMEAYPNVTITRTQFCFNPEAFAALVAGGTLDTLFGVPLTEPQRLISEGVAADLTDSFAKFGIEGVFNTAVLALVSDAEGRIYGFPEFAYAQGIMFNIQMLADAGFESPPATWAELAEVARALTKQPDVAGFAMNMQGGGGGWNFTNIAYGFGATDLIIDNGDGTYTANFGSGKAVEAMQFIYDIKWNGDVFPYDLASNPTLELVADRAALAMNPGDGLGWVRINMPDVDLTKYGYTAVPAGPDGNRYSLTGGSAQLINAAASADEQEAAFVFQLWRQLSSDEFAASREIYHNTQAGSGAPVLKIYAGEYQTAVDAFDAEYIQMPVDNYAGFNDAIAAGEVILVPEPIAAQDFYVAIADVLTTVLTDQGADVPALMQAANDSFQTGILDQMGM